MKVMHVEAGRHLYGGARQLAYLLEGLERRGIGCVLVCPAGSAIGAETRQWVSRVHEVPMGGDLDLGLIRRLRRLIRSERPDLLHLHSRRGADLLGGIAGRLEGVPVVLSRRVDNPEARWLVSLKYRLYDRVITISEGIRRVLLREGVAPDKLVCVRSAVGPEGYRSRCEREAFRREFELPDDTILLGVVAQLIPRKGHRFLLQALPGLLAVFPGLRTIFFGQGPIEARLRQQAGELGLDGRVIFAGFRSDLPRLLPCLDLLVHPALMEGLGIALLQAAGAGLPIVASNAGGMPEAVRDGLNGLLVPPGDVPALTAAIRRLLADPGQMRQMGRAGRELVEGEFSIDRMVEGNLRVYRELLGAGHG